MWYWDIILSDNSHYYFIQTGNAALAAVTVRGESRSVLLVQCAAADITRSLTVFEDDAGRTVILLADARRGE
jgi:hypothetical protein